MTISARRIYFDNNATTPIHRDVLSYFCQISESIYGNPSSVHEEGRLAKALLVDSRKKVANLLGVSYQEVYFFSSATEALNTVLQSILRKSPQAHGITTSVEHAAVYELLEKESRNRPISFVPVGLQGALTAELLEKNILDSTGFISCMSANNETGVLTDLEGIAQIARNRCISLVVDGVAHLGKASLHIPEGVSCMIFSGHKIHAPKGVSVAVIRHPFRLDPLVFGGAQEFGKKPGTENVASIAAFAYSLELFKKDEIARIQHLEQLKSHFEDGLKRKGLDVHINGEGPRVSNTSNISFSGVDGETLLMHLDLAGIAASHGSACASGALEPSRVLLNMGYPRSRVLSSVRFSFGQQNTIEEVDEAIHRIVRIISHSF